MARSVRNPKMDTRSARLKLTERREPYWTVISAGCAIGYRRGTKGGTWVARFRTENGKQVYEALGAADDARDPDGLTVFSFGQAQDSARAFFAQAARIDAGHKPEPSGPYTVKAATEDYLAARERRGSKGVKADRYAANARIVPELGELEVKKLTTKRIRDWHDGIANAPKLVRSKATAKKRATKAIDPTNVEEVRARRSTANRLLTILKAALNYAYREGRAASDEPWRKVQPYREVDVAIVRYLSAAECKRLVNACEVAFRNLVRGALVTGCRYGELSRMQVKDFDASASTISVRLSKSGRPRHVALGDEGLALLKKLTAGRLGNELIFHRGDGKAWGPSHQQRPLEEASSAAKIDPPATFHILRHTYASSLAMKGVPMGVIAAQLGHSDTRMTEKHYAHLAPSYVADTIRASLPALDILEPTNIVGMTA